MNKDKTSYGQIVKSTSLIGGAQLIALIIGLVQTKFVAIYLGPLGIGITGLYGSLLALTTQLTGLGIRASGIKEIAKAAAKDDQKVVSRTVITVRRVCWFTGLAGTVLFMVLAAPLSLWVFGNEDHTQSLLLLASIILLRNIQGGQVALIQGLRRIADLARLQVINAVCGSTVAVGWYFWLGLEGIVPALLSLALLQLFFTWFYVKKIAITKVSISWLRSFRDAKGLVELGIAFMLTALVAMLVNFGARWIINFQIDLVAVGIYQSAFRLSAIYSSFIINAMGADYYPRLVAVADDHIAINRLVNEQTEIALLLAIPGLFVTLVFAPWLIKIFYTADFLPAVELLKWFTIGAVIRVISVPMNYIFVAKGLAKRLVFIETCSSILHILLIWYGIEHFGIQGVAIAYFILNVCYLGLMIILTKHLTGRVWSWGLRRLIIVFLPLIVIVFSSVQLLSTIQAIMIGSFVLILSSSFCLYELTKRLGKNHRISRVITRIPLLKILVHKI